MTDLRPEQAEEILGGPVPDTEVLALGPPNGFQAAPEGGVLVIWVNSQATLWIVPTTADPLTRKDELLAQTENAREVVGLGEAAVSVTRDTGLMTPSRQQAGGAVLIWIDKGYEYRLEANADIDDLVVRARLMSPE
jgi:hypothetical protein